jgi:hypothetical protein
MGILGNGSRPSVVDARAFFDSAIPERIAVIVGMGCLVSIGTTRDRGAISIRVTFDGESDREYFRDPADATDWLDGIGRSLIGAGLGEPERDPEPRQKPTRARQKAPGAR